LFEFRPEKAGYSEEQTPERLFNFLSWHPPPMIWVCGLKRDNNALTNKIHLTHASSRHQQEL